MKFKELNIDPKLLEAISYMGFEEATPIQEQVIPIILNNKDLIACAQTGTGKTAAFVLPILNKLIGKKGNSIDTLIIVPTRELAMQIDQQIQGFSYFVDAGSIAVYGGGDGRDWEQQKETLTHGTDIIIATPGKLLSHLKMGYVNFSTLKHLVLDEADRMLDMGFIDDLQTIFSYLPEKRQNLMFSATMAPEIRKLARKTLHEPEEISLSLSKPAEGVDQKAYIMYEEQKPKMLKYLLSQRKEYDSILIFTSTKSKINDIVRNLNQSGFSAKGISSNLEQDQREAVLDEFRAKNLRILVATDVMSRGIDIKEINMVINHEVPFEAEDYVHRVGRTARVNAKGEAITLVTPRDLFRLQNIEKLTVTDIPKPLSPAEIGPVPDWNAPQPSGDRSRPGGNRSKPNGNRSKPSGNSSKSGESHEKPKRKFYKKRDPKK
ncbi:MAG: DEAD/DEAH box helicase [Salinivirgaceae bacterium]|nr:DEAD/DEAH box helicase [Salinivirgaceae bacterium]MDD4747280.1 DEAD/DEAH box helicase [Salinivirgaceae bacterium]